MKINKNIANQFIAVYREFLLDLYHQYETDDAELKLTEKLVVGREKFSSNRDLFRKFIKKNKNIEFPKEVVAAIENIEIGKWVYLKDTKNYSIILGIDGLSGFGVLGLNDKIREIVGQPPVAIETGIMQIQGHFVCDGLIKYLANLGPNYKKEYNFKFKILKEKQQFKTKNSIKPNNQADGWDMRNNFE